MAVALVPRTPARRVVVALSGFEARPAVQARRGARLGGGGGAATLRDRPHLNTAGGCAGWVRTGVTSRLANLNQTRSGPDDHDTLVTRPSCSGSLELCDVQSRNRLTVRRD